METSNSDLDKLLNLNKSNIDWDLLELRHREIKNELLLKRNQVDQLRKELDDANMKLFELSKQLDANQSALKETEFNYKLLTSQYSTIEEKNKKLNDYYMKTQMKDEMRNTEIDMLKVNIQQVLREKHQLLRENAELKDKAEYNSMLEKEMMDRQGEIKVELARTKEVINKLETEHNTLTSLETKLQYADEIKKLNQFFASNMEKMKEERDKMEKARIIAEAKCDKLAQLLDRNSKIHESGLVEKIKFSQCENRRIQWQKQAEAAEKINRKLTETLRNESETNAKLILKIEENEAKIDELEKKCKINMDPIKKEHEEGVAVIQVD